VENADDLIWDIGQALEQVEANMQMGAKKALATYAYCD